MRIVIHAGMHKTGSSSIQDYLHGYEGSEIVYARWTDANHCGLFILLFEDFDKLPNYHGFKARGPEFIAALGAMKAHWSRRFQEDLENSRDRTLVISAEDISYPAYGNAVKRMHEVLRGWTEDIVVVGYARGPLSFAVSAFQQLLKDGGLNRFQVEQLWPHYSQRFSTLEETFGREHTILRHYDRSGLHGGDVVLDFASILGVDAKAAQPVNSNTSLSAEATALLYLQRRLGDGYLAGFQGAQRGNNAFVDRLRSIGGRRMTFTEALWLPVVQKNLEDLRWMESRLGKQLDDVRPADAVPVGSEDDLIQLALNSYGALENLLVESIRQSSRPPIDRTVRALDLLRKFSY